ncbi:hypothetical protein DL93DRAFT_2084339 [Clavulina sp. PMI_390]|nr:hypothetical protein DL93DRAFT_2084339 [Clavulina sp. PMI_390]
MMNATRILAHELRGSRAKGNVRLSAEYCSSIESLLDFLDAIAAIYPAWADTPTSLKDTLTNVASGLVV